MIKDYRNEPKKKSAKQFAEADKKILVALAGSGDQKAFSELVNREKSIVYSRMLRLCNNQATAEDLTQNTFIESWRSLKKLESTASFDSWLRTISVHVWFQYLKKQNKEREKISELKDSTTILSANNDNVPRLIDLNAALYKLTDAERLHIVLSYHEGMSHSEIVKLTKQPLGTIKSNILRGSKKLRKLLLGYNEP